MEITGPITLKEFGLRVSAAFPRIKFNDAVVTNMGWVDAGTIFEITSDEMHTTIRWNSSKRTWHISIGLGLTRYVANCISIGQARSEILEHIRSEIFRRQEMLNKLEATGVDENVDS